MYDKKDTISDLFQDFMLLKHAMQLKLADMKSPVSQAQKEVLFVVSEQQGASVKEIAERLYITPGAVTQLVEGLINEGQVARETDADDRRIARIYLSPAGKKTVQKIVRLRMSLLESMFEDLADEEIEAFQNAIKKMYQNLQKTQEEPEEDEWQPTNSHQTKRIDIS